MLNIWDKIVNTGIHCATSEIDKVNHRIINEFTLVCSIVLSLYLILNPFVPNLLNSISELIVFINLLPCLLIFYFNSTNRFHISLRLYLYFFPICFAILTLLYGLKASLFSFYIFLIALSVMSKKRKLSKRRSIVWSIVIMLIGIWGSLITGTPYAEDFLLIEDVILSTILTFFIMRYLRMFFIEYRKNYSRLVKTSIQLQNKNKELQDFCHIVSHDLKAPLRGIGSLADMLYEDNEDVLDEESLELLDLMKNRVGRMSDLIDGVLRYSKISTSDEALQDLDLNMLLPEVIDLLAPPAHINIEIPTDLPIIKNQDIKIRQIFQNFISNAIKYNDKEEGFIKVSHQTKNEEHEFCIADNGPGIPEKFHDKIFKIFQTVTNQTNPNSTGVGLTIIKKIIDNNNGKIWIESEEGKGARFYFTLPA